MVCNIWPTIILQRIDSTRWTFSICRSLTRWIGRLSIRLFMRYQKYFSNWHASRWWESGAQWSGTSQRFGNVQVVWRSMIIVGMFFLQSHWLGANAPSHYQFSGGLVGGGWHGPRPLGLYCGIRMWSWRMHNGWDLTWSWGSISADGVGSGCLGWRRLMEGMICKHLRMILGLYHFKVGTRMVWCTHGWVKK